MNKICPWIFLFCSFLPLFSYSQNSFIKGTLTSKAGESLPFASVYVQHTSRGTLTNSDGIYSLELSPGEYDIIYKIIGYKQQKEHVVLGKESLTLNVALETESYQMKEVTVTDGEDPAYAVIRNAIKNRKKYLEQVEAFSCDVYIKGLQRITKYPEKIMGIQIDPRGNIDSKTGIIYLSESVSTFNFQQPDKIKEEMISSKVSGNNRAFSYNQASDMLINFYENFIEIRALSRRGFISPIAGNALFFYNYKLAGTFFEGDHMVNKIEVIPKRKNDPVFRGYIYIMENSWRIHSTELYLSKEAQINFVDTLSINQLFLPVEKEVWMVSQNKYIFSFGILGIEGNGMYIGFNSNYNLSPAFPRKYFNGEEMKVYEEANKKDTAYWDSIRPVQLTREEETDYVKRDSLEVIRNSEPYLDSIDRRSNKPALGKILLTGYTYYQRYHKRRFEFSPLVRNIAFNTVQGWNAGLNIRMNKSLERNRRYTLEIKPSYGFSNRHWNGTASFQYNYKPEKLSSFDISGGLQTVQFNPSSPIPPLVNTLNTLFDKRNYMKLHEQWFARAEHRMELINGLVLGLGAAYADRMPLKNTSTLTFSSAQQRHYTSNDPVFPMNDSAFSFTRNQLLEFSGELRIRFMQKYMTRPHRKIITGSKYPAFILRYNIAVPAIAESDMKYSQASISVRDQIRLKLLGTVQYRISAGKFLGKGRMEFMDYHHFYGNQTIFSTFPIESFNLLPYYTYSTNHDFIEAHLEHNFGGFILNKFPLIRKLKLNEMAGIHFFTGSNLPRYAEVFFGMEKLRVLRIDFVLSFMNEKQLMSGFRFGVNL